MPCLFGVWVLGAVPIQRSGCPIGSRTCRRSLGSAPADGRPRRRARASWSRPRCSASRRARRGRRPPPARRRAAARRAPRGLAARSGARAGPALIQLTSGSTGHPRGVVIPHERLMLHLDAMGQAAHVVRGEGARERRSCRSTTTWASSAGCSSRSSTISPFTCSRLSSSGRGRSRGSRRCPSIRGVRPRSGRRAPIPSASGLARRAVEAGPRSRRVAVRDDRRRADLPALLRRFAEAFAPCGFRVEAFFSVYGLAEAAVAVTFPDLYAEPRASRWIAACWARGRVEEAAAWPPLAGARRRRQADPHTEIRIVDAQRGPVPERTVGRSKCARRR